MTVESDARALIEYLRRAADCLDATSNAWRECRYTRRGGDGDPFADSRFVATVRALEELTRHAPEYFPRDDERDKALSAAAALCHDVRENAIMLLLGTTRPQSRHRREVWEYFDHPRWISPFSDTGNPGDELRREAEEIELQFLRESLLRKARSEAEWLELFGAVSPEPWTLPLAESVPEVETSAPRQTARPGTPREELERRAREYLAKHARPDHKVGQRELAQAIGCADGTVSKLAAWRAYQDEYTRRNPPKSRRAVGLPADDVLGDRDAELDRLVSEQAAEDDDRPGRRPRERKRV